MTQKIHSDIKSKAFLLRTKGFSLAEISFKCKIAKSTASLLLRKVKLSNNARHRLDKIMIDARLKAAQKHRSRHLIRLRQSQVYAQQIVS